jgi:hypothetical protein
MSEKQRHSALGRDGSDMKNECITVMFTFETYSK